MKTKVLSLFLAVVFAGIISANAVPINITMSLPLNGSSTLVGDVQAQNIPGSGLGVANVLSWLQLDVTTYDNNLAMSLVAPVDISSYASESTSGSLIINAGDFLVLHYGAGPGGSPSGGLVALYFATTAAYSVPQNGSGPNGNGGISFVSLYAGSSVPDGGSTVFLLGTALSGLGMVARRLKK
jgi:hypothetical protein